MYFFIKSGAILNIEVDYVRRQTRDRLHCIVGLSGSS